MLVLVDKPKGISSHTVVSQLRRITRVKRIGHAGTLDPNASGLLIVGIGRESTKKLGEVAKATRKTYLAEIYLGEERTTDDNEGSVVRVWDQLVNPAPTLEMKLPSLRIVQHIVTSFIGKQKQTPPIYSAIKKEGKKAYELARKGEIIKMEPRDVEIFDIKLITYKFPLLILEVECSAGTYIRALARDIGRSLGTYGFLKELRRTKIGEYKVEDAAELDKITIENIERFQIIFN